MLSFFPRNVLDEILNLIESVSEGFPTYSFINSRSNCLKPRNAVRHKAVFLCSLYCKNSVFFFFGYWAGMTTISTTDCNSVFGNAGRYNALHVLIIQGS